MKRTEKISQVIGKPPGTKIPELASHTSTKLPSAKTRYHYFASKSGFEAKSKAFWEGFCIYELEIVLSNLSGTPLVQNLRNVRAVRISFIVPCDN